MACAADGSISRCVIVASARLRLQQEQLRKGRNSSCHEDAGKLLVDKSLKNAVRLGL